MNYHRLALSYACVAILAALSVAYDLAIEEGSIDYSTTVIPYVGFALTLAILIYCVVRIGCAEWERVHNLTQCNTAPPAGLAARAA